MYCVLAFLPGARPATYSQKGSRSFGFTSPFPFCTSATGQLPSLGTISRITAWGRFRRFDRGTNDNQLSTISVRLRTQNLRFFRRQNTFIVLRLASLLHCSKHNQIGIAHFSKGRTGAAVTCLEKATGAAAREALLRERARDWDWSLREARGLPALRWRQEWDQGHQWLAPPGVCHASDP